VLNTLNQKIMHNESVTGWIDQLADGNEQAARELWEHVSTRVCEFARQKLDPMTRRRYDENDAANSAFHSLCRGISDGRLEAKDRNALWGLLAVITSRKISAQLRRVNRQKRGSGAVRGDSGFAELGDAGINAVGSKQPPPEELAEVAESCAQLLDALPDETLKKIVLLKFQGATNGEVAGELNCTQRTIERKLERIRRIWTEAGLHDGEP
jgi:RNA polymerase sigma factor (sigma-70 family)